MYSIIPLKVGSLLYYRGAFTGKTNQYGEMEDFPILSFLIQGEGKNILVDTGGGDPENPYMKAAHRNVFRPEAERPDNALRAIGVDPASIDTVILTHLHWDHCYNNDLFPQATFYVQTKEILYASHPVERFFPNYETYEFGMIPPWARHNTKWHFVDGEYQLCDGIRLIPVPGHTPGMQGIMVDTAKGPHFIASDAIACYECIVDGKCTPSTLIADVNAYYDTCRKMTEMIAQGIVVIPGHDYEVLKHKKFPEL